MYSGADMKFSKIILIAAMTNCLSLQQAFSMPIEDVQVRIVDAGGSTSEVLLQKMTDSMQVVAQQLLLDKETEDIVPVKAEYAKLLTEIGDRALTGYEMQQTEINLGQQTEIVLHVAPWSDTIGKVEIDLQFSGVEPQTAVYLQQRLPGLEQKLQEIISGASVDAQDWAGGVLRRVVRQEVEESLPEFKAAVDLLQEDGKVIVQVIIYPVGQLISGIKYEMRSESIPNLLLNRLKFKYADECERLQGIPVSYLEHHRQEYIDYLSRKLAAESEVRRYNLKPRINIQPGAATAVEIILYSDEYKIWLEGYGDIGRDKDNLSGKAHLGKFISPQDEIFTEAEVVLDDVQWQFGAGYTRYWGKSSWSYMRRAPADDNVYKLEYTLSPKWKLRAEHFSGDDRNEYGVRYRIHEFLSAEYVYGGDEFYLRLIGNL